LKRRVLALVLVLWVGVGLIACGGYSAKLPPSGLADRVLASQEVSATRSFGGLVVINGFNDTLAAVHELSAGNSPGLMAISPTRNIVVAFDSNSNSVYAVSTTTEANLGTVQLSGPTYSMVVPTAEANGYAAVPSARVDGFSFVGAVVAMNLSTGATLNIAVPSAETVVANTTGAQLLVFSNGSDSMTVLNPTFASPPVDTSCLANTPNLVCTIVPGFSRPVYAIINGTNAYVFNCGFQCGGTQQASIMVVNLGTLAITNTIPVNGATYGMIVGSNLYVAGLGTPTGPLCASIPSAAPTAATYCGTLDIIDLNTLLDPYYNNPSMEIAITDGTHDEMDMSSNGQLFVGSYDCTNIGSVNNPNGEVRGCLAIYNTNNNTVVFPPDNGDVNGLQSFSTRYVEYVAQGGNLRVYDTVHDILLINDFVPQGSINITGYVGDVKAIDFF